jgi:hypothetical protein
MSNTDYYAGQLPYGPGTQPQPGQQQYPGEQYAAVPPVSPPPGQPIRHDGLAKAAFITVWFVPLAGIIIGHISNRQRKARQLSRDGLAVAALWLGYGFTALWTLFWIVMIAVAASTPTASAFTPSAANPPAAVAPAAPAPATSAPVEAPTSDAPAAPVGTASQQQALQSAQGYLSDGQGFSRNGLIEQLEYEKFSPADAAWAADHSGANWNDQAVTSAKGYMSDGQGFSRQGLIDQLEYEKFTVAQATYAVNHVGLTGGSAAPAAQAASAVPAGYTDAGGGVYAGPNTSTAFALAVHQAWLDSGKASTVTAYSPVTGKTYTMTQAGSSPYLFTGGNNASVEWWA